MRKVISIYVLLVVIIVTMNLQIAKVLSKPYVEKYDKLTQHIKGYFEKFQEFDQVDKECDEYRYKIYYNSPLEDRKRKNDVYTIFSVEYNYENVKSITLSHTSPMDINFIKNINEDFCKPVNEMLNKEIIDLNIIEEIYSKYMVEKNEINEKREMEGYIIYYDISPKYSVLESENDPNRKPQEFDLRVWIDLRKGVKLEASTNLDKQICGCFSKSVCLSS
ncbi:hypothetical protein GCM10008905_31670 [Clostridium malenominatum]|uniref:Uncharacterized protein n=1 Tax=Clostridium malenominatum TaxID=1539 RepID=A0ABN1J6N9_9CLOT